MSLEYFHYAKTVLGVSHVFKPQALKKFYNLHHGSETSHSNQPFILFVCKEYGDKEKILIDNMNQAVINNDFKLILHFTLPAHTLPQDQNICLSSSEQKMMIQIFNSMLLRFHPGYIVWFDLDFAKLVLGENITYGKNIFEIPKTKATNLNAHSYPLAVLDPIHNFLEGTRIKETKQKAWKTLQNFF